MKRIWVIEVTKELRNEARQKILREQKYQVEYLHYLQQFIMKYQAGDAEKESNFSKKKVNTKCGNNSKKETCNT